MVAIAEYYAENKCRYWVSLCAEILLAKIKL